MTQEERLKLAKETWESSMYDKATIEHIFPELKESEDEQHRRWILEYLYDGLYKSDEQFKDQFKSAISWLEKQGKTAWKPSDEQMEALDKVLSCANLNYFTRELLCDLYASLNRLKAL